jgi:hypothetical protein
VLINVGTAVACVGTPTFVRAGAALDRWTFEAGNATAGVRSTTARLNGAELVLRADGSLPPLGGAHEAIGPGLELPAQSVTLLLLPAGDGAALACD